LIVSSLAFHCIFCVTGVGKSIELVGAEHERISAIRFTVPIKETKSDPRQPRRLE
jgi:hypothetical protein